jgi:DNA-binding MarR family transcriptional regulator
MTRSILQPPPADTNPPSPPPLDPLIEAIVADVQSAWCRMRAGASERLLRNGVSMAHMHLLWLLAHQGPLPMSRIAEALDISLSNASGFIDRMEERGLVERVRVPDDRRVVLVRVSTGGQAAMDELEFLRRDHMANILGRLTSRQLAGIRQALLDIRQAYESEGRTSHPEAH